MNKIQILQAIIPVKVVEFSEKTGLSKVTFLYTGEFYHPAYGEINITKNDLQHGIDNFIHGKGARKDEKDNWILPGNFQHSSGDPNHENAIASGWLHNFELSDDGNVVNAYVMFTDRAKEYIKNKEYLYISPEFTPNYWDENDYDHGFTFLGFALTNINFLKKNQKPVQLTDKDINMDNKELMKILNLTDESKIDETLLNLVKSVSEQKTKIAKLKEMVTEFTEKNNELSKKLETATNADNDKIAQILKLTERIEAVEKEANRKAIETTIREFVFNPLTKTGKIYPSQIDHFIELYEKDETLAKNIIEKMPDIKFDDFQGTANDSGGSPTNKLREAINDLQEKNVNMTLSDAITKLRKTSPELFNQYSRFTNE